MIQPVYTMKGFLEELGFEKKLEKQASVKQAGLGRKKKSLIMRIMRKQMADI